MSTWLDKFGGVSTTTSVSPLLAVATEPGWNVLGTFPSESNGTARLDVIGSVSDASLTMTVRLYCVSAGSIGEVAGSRATLASVIDVRAGSTTMRLAEGLLYQVQAQVVGNAGDSYFGQVRRAVPVPIS